MPPTVNHVLLEAFSVRAHPKIVFFRLLAQYLSICSKNNPRNINHMPVVIFSHALILKENPHLWTDTY
jgi:hypothetical protein